MSTQHFYTVVYRDDGWTSGTTSNAGVANSMYHGAIKQKGTRVVVQYHNGRLSRTWTENGKTVTA
jgi:hypothetical protein